MNVTSINATLGKWINKGLDTQNCVGRFFSRQFDSAINDPATYAARMLLLSIVSKDAVGCYVYTTQSLHNKEIPEENRGYVAALDAVNGVLMVVGQLGLGRLIEKRLAPKWFARFYSGVVVNPTTKVETDLMGKYGKMKSRLDRDNMGKMVRNYVTKHKLKDIDCDAIAEKLYKNYGAGSIKHDLIKTGFGIVVTALGTTAFVKRFLVPLIATPVSGRAKDWLAQKTKEKKGAAQVNKEKPSEPPIYIQQRIQYFTPYMSGHGLKPESSTAFKNFFA